MLSAETPKTAAKAPRSPAAIKAAERADAWLCNPKAGSRNQVCAAGI